MPTGDLTLYTSGYSLLEKTKLAQSEQRRQETLDSSGRPKVERFFIEDTYSVVAPRAAAPSVGVSTTTFTSDSFTTDFATSPTPTLFPTPSPSPSAGIPSGFIPDFSSGATEFADLSQAAGGGPDPVLDSGYGDEPNRLRRKFVVTNKYKIARLENLFPRYLINTDQLFRPGEWFVTTARSKWDGDYLSCPADAANPEPYSLANFYADFVEDRRNINNLENSYSDFSEQLAPSLSYRDSLYSLPKKILPTVIDKSFVWLSNVTVFTRTYHAICGAPFREITFEGHVSSDGPTFPRQTINSKLVATQHLVSSTSTYIYFSAVLRYRSYDVVTVETPFRTLGNETSRTKKNIRIKDYTATDIGYYVRFNTKNLTIEHKKVTLSNQFVERAFFTNFAEQPFFFLSSSLQQAFASNFYPDDPRSSLSASNLEQALDYDINHFSYDPNTGGAYFYGQNAVTFFTNGSPNQLSPDAFVYFTRFTKGTPYGEVVSVLKNAKFALTYLTTAPEVLIDNSFTQTFTLKQIIPLGGVEVASPPRNFFSTSGISEILAIVPNPD